MKDNLLKYILIVSLLLNFSLLGTAAYTHYHRVPSPRATPVWGPGKPSGPPPSWGPKMLFEELSLKPEQVRLFQEKAAVFHGALARKNQEVGRLRASLITLMRADVPDSQAIEAAISRIGAAQQDIQKMGVSHMLEFKSLLDQDQQKRFLDLIQRAMAQRNEAICP